MENKTVRATDIFYDVFHFMKSICAYESVKANTRRSLYVSCSDSFWADCLKFFADQVATVALFEMEAFKALYLVLPEITRPEIAINNISSVLAECGLGENIFTK